MALDLSKFTRSGRIQSRGANVAGGTGPVRMKKGQNIFQAIIGAFIGVILVIASPIAMWQAQSQHGAKDFATAVQVEADSGASGYVEFRGAPEYANETGGTSCYQANCIYENASYQELVTEVDLVCAENVREDEYTRVLRQNGSECDEYGDCVPCWDVEKDSWKEQRSTDLYYDVKVGNFTVDPTGAITFDTDSKTIETGLNETSLNPTRTVYTYFVMPSQLLVAGYSDGSLVQNGEMPFVLSQYDHEMTLDKMEARDRMNKIILMIVTFIMLFLGISLILGPLSWMGRQMKYIPGVGKMLAKGSNSMIGLAALIIAIPLWVILFIAVSLLKAWWLGLIIVALVVAYFVWKSKNGSKDKPAEPAAPSAPATPPTTPEQE